VDVHENGDETRYVGTRWRCVVPEIRFELQFNEPRWKPNWPRFKSGAMIPAVVKSFHLRKGEEIVLPREMDFALQQIKCSHPRCNTMKMFCRNYEHIREWLVVGGVAPGLSRVNAPQPDVHPTMIPLHTATTYANSGSPRVTANQDADSRLMQRARAAKGQSAL
jgi:hypothetical protein